MPAAFPFDAAQDLVTQGVQQHLANASVGLMAGGPTVGALYDSEAPQGSPFQDVATAARHMLSLCIVGLGDVAEGDEVIVTTRQWPAGQRCRITTPVEPDAGGWAVFEVVPVA